VGHSRDEVLRNLGRRRQVIPIRLTRMAVAGANPSAADRREMSVMGTEKLDAFSRAGLAFATAMTPAAMNLGMQAYQGWMAILDSGARLAASRTVPQTLRRQRALAHSLVRHGPATHRARMPRPRWRTPCWTGARGGHGQREAVDAVE
jgi:hypothetical protein